jgi:serine/threonine protein kinase
MPAVLDVGESSRDGAHRAWPPHVGGYEVVQELPGPERPVLALAPGNRRVVLKPLDPDCLLRSGANPKLHATIRDRLARIRELAHARIANLYGVEHDQRIVYLVWEYVEGQPLEEWATNEQQRRPSPKELLLAARELILTIEALHARGIVHGAIHGRNVIVDPQGKLKLTHISPLLYSEPRHDLDSIADLFSHIARHRGEAESPLDRLAQEVDDPDATLRSLGARASSLIDLRRDEASEEQQRRGDARRRHRSRLAAALVLLAALGLSWEIRQSVRRLTPPPPSPPQAPPAAME